MLKVPPTNTVKRPGPSVVRVVSPPVSRLSAAGMLAGQAAPPEQITPPAGWVRVSVTFALGSPRPSNGARPEALGRAATAPVVGRAPVSELTLAVPGRVAAAATVPKS